MPDSPELESLFVRLYFDRHIIARLALDLRGRGFDILRTEEAGKDQHRMRNSSTLRRLSDADSHVQYLRFRATP